MTSPADGARDPRIDLLDGLRHRLEQADRLTTEVREALKRADAGTIDESSARLATIALEFKVLVAEYRRLPAPEPGSEDELLRARFALDETATSLARNAALGGGLLQRLVAMSQRLIGVLQSARGEPYLATGRTGDLAVEGLRLRERA